MSSQYSTRHCRACSRDRVRFALSGVVCRSNCLTLDQGSESYMMTLRSMLVLMLV